MAVENKDEIFKKELSKQFYNLIKKVLVTEKATRQIEFENKMTFEVAKEANKEIIKLLIETELKKKVKKVNIHNSFTGEKRAIVTFADEGVASDLSSEFGLV
jgi:ribosomal protein L23